VTVGDVVALAGLALGAGVVTPVADALTVAAASAASWRLHRSVTFGDDPFIRWVHEPRAFARFVLTAAVAGTVDVAVVSSAALGPRPGAAGLLGAKAVALAAAGSLRLVAYRAVLWTDVRQALGTRRSRPEAPGDLRLSVVVPAYQEEARIGEAVRRLRDALTPATGTSLEIVVVDDGSSDRTAAEAIVAGARVLRLPANRGKGAAVRAGVLASAGRCIAFTDADLAYPPEQVLSLLEEVESGWDVVVGSRRHPSSTDEAGARGLRTVSARLFNLLTASVLLGQYRDTQCGLKAFRSDAARLLFSRTRLDGFAFDVEVLHLVERYRLCLTEVPVTLVSAPGSTVSVARDALGMVRDLFRVRRWAGQGAYDLPVPATEGEGATR